MDNLRKQADMTHSRRARDLHVSRSAGKNLLARGIRTDSGCLEWSMSRDRRGYGWTYIDGRTIKVHRAAFAAFVRPLVAGELVCHHCDNPACFEPSHLFAGDHADNNRDMHEKGRFARTPGEAHSRVKLTEQDVHEIRERRARGDSGHDLARAFNVHPNTIYAACTRASWKHLA